MNWQNYKFRGKSMHDGTWACGALLRQVVRTRDSADEINPLIFNTACKNIRVLPETVGMYTGLKDKNGREIWEGDIIDCWSEGVNAQGKVQQRKDGLWIIYPAWQKRIMWGLCPSENGSTTVEVIGNVWDNEDLLNG